MQIYPETPLPQRANNVLKLPGVNYVCEKLRSSHDVKSFAISALLLNKKALTAVSFYTKQVLLAKGFLLPTLSTSILFTCF